MNRGILLAGNESPLSLAIAAEAAKRVEQFATALIPNRFAEYSMGDKISAEAAMPLSWNPNSPVSARALILAAENRLVHIHDAVLICAPPSMRKPLDELSLAEIEIMINEHIKGWFFLAKELIAIFKIRQAGNLTFVLSELESKDDVPDLLGPMAAASFKAFAQNISAISQDEPYQIMAFSASPNADNNAFAAFIFKTLDEKSKRGNNKWHKYGGNVGKLGGIFPLRGKS